MTGRESEKLITWGKRNISIDRKGRRSDTNSIIYPCTTTQFQCFGLDKMDSLLALHTIYHIYMQHQSSEVVKQQLPSKSLRGMEQSGMATDAVLEILITAMLEVPNKDSDNCFKDLDGDKDNQTQMKQQMMALTEHKMVQKFTFVQVERVFNDDIVDLGMMFLYYSVSIQLSFYCISLSFILDVLLFLI